MMYPTRLRWERTRGVARHEGIEATLAAFPQHLGIPDVTELDFVPNIIAAVRQRDDAIRDLAPEETAEILKMLYRMASGARDALDGQSTLVVVIK